MSKPKKAQAYTPEEFDQIVNLLTTDASIRADIEAITGQSLDGRSPRELFNLFRAISGAATVQEAVARFGRARRQLRQVRAELASDMVEHIADHPDVPTLARQRIVELETRLDEMKARMRALEQQTRRLAAGAQGAVPQASARAARAARVIRGEVSA